MAVRESIIRAWFGKKVIALRPPADWRPHGRDQLSDFRFIAEMLHHMEHGGELAEVFRQQARQALSGGERPGGQALDGGSRPTEMIIGGEDLYDEYKSCAVRHLSYVWCEGVDAAGYPTAVSVCPWEHGRGAKRFRLIRWAPGTYEVLFG